MKPKNSSILIVALILCSCASTQQRQARDREKDPQFQYEKAVVCMQYGMTDEALKYLNLTLNLDPRYYLAYNLLGLAHMIKGNLPEAIKAFEKCLEINPGFSEGHNNLGTALSESDSAERAEEEFKKAFAIDQNYNASYNLAKLYYVQKKMDLALDYVQKSIQKYSRSVLAFNLQGLIFDSQTRFEEAIASFEQALKLAPDEINVKFNLAATYYKKGDLETSKGILEKILPEAKSEELKARINDMLKRIKGL
jgi:protein O-GlcNAc transferase